MPYKQKKQRNSSGEAAPDNLMSLCDFCHGKIHSARGDHWHNKIGSGSRNAAEKEKQDD